MRITVNQQKSKSLSGTSEQPSLRATDTTALGFKMIPDYFTNKKFQK